MPRKSPLPDPRYSVKLRLIETHYANFGDELRWTADRFRRLAAHLGYTVYELGALVRLHVHETEQALARNRFSRPVDLHLSLIERSLLPTSKPPLFPQL